VEQQQAPPPSRVEIRTQVRPDPDRKPARTVTAVDKWNYDRGRVERCTIYTDRIDYSLLGTVPQWINEAPSHSDTELSCRLLRWFDDRR
jgi:hypothetical protein